jgi:hypothetical protein
MHLAQGRDQWRALQNTVIEIKSSIGGAYFLEYLGDSFFKGSAPGILLVT